MPRTLQRRATSLVLTVATCVATVLVAAPATATPATPPPSTPIKSGSFVDLGPNATLGNVIQIDAAGDVLTTNGFWHDGTFTTPGPVAGADGGTPMTIEDMGPNGTVVGFDNVFQGQRTVIWNPLAGTNPTFAPQFPDEPPPRTQDGCGGEADYGTTVSSSNEIGGGGEFLYGTQPGCAPSVIPEAYTATISGNNEALVPQLKMITDLAGRWAVGSTLAEGNFFGFSNGDNLLNRASGTVTQLGLATLGQNALSNDGTVVGADINNPTTATAEYQEPGGVATALKLPADETDLTNPGFAYAINDTDQIVGANNAGVGLLWESPTATPVELDSGLPLGWVMNEADAIDDAGDVAGEASSSASPEDVKFVVGTPNDLSASITLNGPNGTAFSGGASSVGSTLVATVTLSAAVNAAAPITGITVEPPLSVSPTSDLTAVSGPTPAPPNGGFTLQPGASTSYTMTYQVASTGTANLSVTAAGVEAGTSETGTAQVAAHLGQPIDVSVSWLQNGQPIVLNPASATPQPDTIKLADTDAGEVAQDVTAVVTLTNSSVNTQDNVNINGIPALSYHVASQATQALPIAVTAGPSTTGTWTSIAPGDSKTATYTLNITNNGSFDFSPQVLSSDDGTSNTNVSSGVGTITAVPTALLWLALKPLTTDVVKAGTAVLVSGTVTNRSLTQALDLNDLLPSERTGNAGGGGLFSDTAAPNVDGTTRTFNGQLDPGQTVDLTGVVATAQVPGTRASVSYSPSGKIINSDNSETTLTSQQVGMSAGSSPISFSLSTSDPTLPPATISSTVANFTEGAMLGAVQFTAGELVAGAQLLHDKGITGAASTVIKGAADFAVNTTEDVAATAQAIGAMYVLQVVGDSMTTQEKGDFANQIVNDFTASHAGADVAGVRKAADAFLPDLMTAISTHNYNKVATIAGNGVGAAGAGIVEGAVTDLGFQKLALGLKTGAGVAKTAFIGDLADAVSLADALRTEKVATTLGKGLAGVKAGQNLLADSQKALTDIYGLTTKQIADLRAFCAENKIIIAVRSRSKKAASLIERGLAIGKNEELKIKNVNDIDVKFLGYKEGDLNTVVWASPVDESYVEARLKHLGADDTVREIVNERYKLRTEQWNDEKIRHVIDDGKKTGTINWSFNGSDNGAPGANKSSRRRFGVYQPKHDIPGGAGRTYEQVLVGDKPGLKGHLVPVTQDVDMMAALGANGSILSAEQRTKVYLYLSDVLGIEHPETPTWIKDGEMLFKAKAKQLADTIPGGEALAVFGPDSSVRAGFYNPALCLFNNVTKGGAIFFEGGYNNAYAKAITSIKISLKGMG
jgi:hypothetical protein